MFNHVMLDLETLSSESNAVLVSIGAYAFNVDDVDNGVGFYTTVDPETCVAAGLHMSTSTVLWWMGQSEAARKAVIAAQGGPSLWAALLELSKWYYEHAAGALVWGNGASFDNVVIDSALKAVKLQRPWSYRLDVCYRTLAKLHPDIPKPLMRDGEVQHHALDDAKWQARHLAEILRHMGRA